MFQSSSIQQKCNKNVTCSHVKKKKGEINFGNIFYLTQYIQPIIILTCNQYFKFIN